MKSHSPVLAVETEMLCNRMWGIGRLPRHGWRGSRCQAGVWGGRPGGGPPEDLNEGLSTAGTGAATRGQRSPGREGGALPGGGSCPRPLPAQPEPWESCWGGQGPRGTGPSVVQLQCCEGLPWDPCQRAGEGGKASGGLRGPTAWGGHSLTGRMEKRMKRHVNSRATSA